MDRADVKQIIDSIYNTTKLSEGRSIDINLKCKGDEIIIYVNKMIGMQISHKLSSSNGISVTTNQNTTLVFSSKVFRNIVNKTASGRLEIEFNRQRYHITTSSMGSFSEPLSLSLYIFSEEEPRAYQTHDQVFKLATLNRVDLKEALDVMSSITNAVDISLVDETLSFTVSDKVEGDGSIRTDVNDECSLNYLEGTYDLDILKEFVSSVNSGEIELLATPHFDIMVQTIDDGIVSKLDLAPKST